MFQKLRLQWFFLRRTLGYTSDYLDLTYQIYLNHHKIIHYRDGFPVYSLSTPSAMSKPATNLFARSFFRSVQNRNMPNLMSFAVNDVCNVGCKHCSFFSGVDDKSRTVLNLKESQSVIAQAQELGVSVINFVGGEPTLRKDLPELIASVDKNLSTTVMFTNGLLLKEQAQTLRSHGLDSVYVSIDSSNPKTHDAFRRKKGLFEKAMEGIQEAKRVGMTVGLSCCLTPETFRRGELDKMVELGKSVGVHEVLLFDAMPTGRYRHRVDLVDNQGWIEDMIQETKKYNTRSDYPGVLVYAYAMSHRSVGCVCGTSYLYISPYGDMMSCDFNHKAFGNVIKEPMYKVWDQMTSRSEFQKSKWGGCKVKDSTSRKSDCVECGSSCSG